MIINEDLLKHLTDVGLPQRDVIPYLLSLYFGYQATYIPDILKAKVFAQGIIKEDKEGLIWLYPLFEGTQSDDSFDWIQSEYIKLFTTANPSKKPFKRECRARMKDFFKKYPQYRKDDVIEATKLYLNSTDYRYIRDPHYFISKGSGVEATTDLLTWVETVYEKRKNKESEKDKKAVQINRMSN